MIKVGLTGGIGSGKSTVSRIFSVFNVPVFYADNEAKKLYLDKAIIEQVKFFFGNKVFFENNALNKKALAKIVFNDKQALKKLNEIIHPGLIKRLNLWLESYSDAKYVVQEAAILFETGFYKMFDKTISVSAKESLRISRVMARVKAKRSEVLARIGNQWSDNKRESYSDFVIHNNEQEMLLPQLISIHKELLSL